MGGGASKRAALAEELNSRVAARDEDTLSMVEQDKKRRQQKKLALAVQAAWRGHEGRRRAWENEQAVRRWADEVVRHPHRPLPGDPVAYYRGTLRGRAFRAPQTAAKSGPAPEIRRPCDLSAPGSKCIWIRDAHVCMHVRVYVRTYVCMHHFPRTN